MNAPYTEGDLGAPLVLVGEAPGEYEERGGGAFVGPAGQLLTTLLNTAGIPRATCYLDNVFQFRPKGNKLEPYIKFTGNSVKLSTEYHVNREALISRLRNTQATTIVTLGNVPTYALTGRTRVTKQRGSVLACPELPGKKIIPTIHPSAALRGVGGRQDAEGKQVKDGYIYRYWIIYDLQRAARNSRIAESPLLDRDLRLVPRFREVLDFISHCRSLPSAAYDIETRGLEVSHLAIAATPELALCIPFIDGPRDYWTPGEELTILRAIRDFLQDPKVEKIGQNLTFDATFLYDKFGIVTENLQDTMVAQGVLFPDFPKGLDFLTSIYCNGEPYYKDDGKEWFKNPFGSEEVFRRYNAMDAAVLMEIWPQQKAELIRQNNWETYCHQRDLIPPLVYAGNKGTRVNVQGMAEASKGCAARIEALQAELNQLCGKEINPKSSKQLQEYFYVTKHLRAHTKDGKVTTDDKAMKSIAAKGHREAQLVLDLRHEHKLQGTYYEMKLDPDNRFRCSYNPVGTAQGRVSSSKTIRGTGGNAQNQPADMAKLFLADPGYILVNQDLGQAENRVVAFVAGEEKMMRAFELGIDIHTQTASLIYGVPMDQVSEELRAGGKRANHGLNYDLGPKEFARYYQMLPQDAAFIVEAYHRVYPGVREWHAQVRYELGQNNRTLVNCYGRRRTFLLRWGEDLFKVGYSFIPQSTVADHMRDRGVNFLFYSQDKFPEVQFLNTIHDSIRYQIPLSVGLPRVVDILLGMKSSLETPISYKQREFSIPADTELGFSFDKSTMLKWKASFVSKQPREALVEGLQKYVSEAQVLDR